MAVAAHQREEQRIGVDGTAVDLDVRGGKIVHVRHRTRRGFASRRRPQELRRLKVPKVVTQGSGDVRHEGFGARLGVGRDE
ncbi:hypothetical protein GCM10010219_13300 [Streptomyces netropsis]|nr:hypothetical protein GCM10010219_13300 [Streptomyces netropsis]